MALDKYRARVKLSEPATRGRQSSREKVANTDLARQIASLRDDYGLTLHQIRHQLGEKLRRKIPLSTLYAWSDGAVPRKIPLAQIDEAIAAVMAEHERIEGGAWVDAEEIRAQIREWGKTLSFRQIAIVADEYQTVIESWSYGRHRTKRHRWNRVVERVEDALKEMRLHKHD